MAKTRSMTRNQNHNYDASSSSSSSSSRKSLKTTDYGITAPWSDLDHNVLCLVVMQLGVVDFVSFSGVCKSWRSLAPSNWNMFMASKPPMTIHVSRRGSKRPCYLQEVEGRKFKTIIPDFPGGICIGLTCGYLIFFGRKTRDFWLVNPITRRELRFPDFPDCVYIPSETAFLAAVLVFLPSISQWAFAVLCGDAFKTGIWVSIMGKGTWTHVPSTLKFLDLHVFKGKIYTLTGGLGHLLVLSELILNPEPKLTSIVTKNSAGFYFDLHQIASSGENIYVTGIEEGRRIIYEIDFAEMKWVSREKTMGEHALFISDCNMGVAVKPESWADPWSPYQRYADGFCCCCCTFRDRKLSGENTAFIAKMWYFPRECLNIDC